MKPIPLLSISYKEGIFLGSHSELGSTPEAWLQSSRSRVLSLLLLSVSQSCSQRQQSGDGTSKWPHISLGLFSPAISFLLPGLSQTRPSAGFRLPQDSATRIPPALTSHFKQVWETQWILESNWNLISNSSVINCIVIIPTRKSCYYMLLQHSRKKMRRL